jgi:hypothetical protein
MIFGVIQLGLIYFRVNTVEYVIEQAAREVLLDPTLDEAAVQVIVDTAIAEISPQLAVDVTLSIDESGPVSVVQIRSDYEQALSLPLLDGHTFRFSFETFVPRE